jgi:hypothetical protein
LATYFIYEVSGEVMAKFYQEPNLYRKVQSVQISPIQQSVQVLMALTHKSLTVSSRIMNHWKAERVTYRLGIRQFGRFRFAYASEFYFFQLLCCPVQFSAVWPMSKILYHVNRWSDEVVYVTNGKLSELSNFLVFNSGEESHLNSPRF